MCNEYESRLASQALRDREFDSAVRADFNKAAEPERIEAGTERLNDLRADFAAIDAAPTKRPEPFAAINAAWESITSAVASGDLQGAQEAAQKAVDATLQPYYQGLGEFDHVRFLADLETSKGSALNQAELVFFGRVAGDWVATKHLAEIEAIPDHDERNEARREAFLRAIGISTNVAKSRRTSGL